MKDLKEKLLSQKMGLDKISHSNLRKLLHKQTIVTVHHVSEIHWTCTFVFNLMHCTNEWEIENIAKSKSLNPNRATKHGEWEDDRTSGHMCYDPFICNADYQEEREKTLSINLSLHCVNVVGMTSNQKK